MLEFTGWLGFWLLIGTMLPFILRRVNLRRVEAMFFSRNHHDFALFTLLVLTIHGLLALTVKRGWGRGAFLLLKGDALSGLFAWSVLAAVVLLAVVLTTRKSSLRAHCWLAGLLVLLVLNHVF